MITFLAILFIACFGFYKLEPDCVWLPKEVFTLIGIGFLLSKFLYEKQKFLGLFTAYVTLVYLIHLLLAWGQEWRPEILTMDGLINIYGYIGLFALLRYWVLTPDRIFLILKAVSLFAVIQALYGILQYVEIDYLFKPTGEFPKNIDRMVGFIGNPSALAVYLAISLPAVLACHHKILRFASAFVILAAIFLTRTYTVIVPLFLFSIFAGIFWNPYWLLVLCATPLSFSFWHEMVNGFSSRLTVWMSMFHGMDIFHFIFGHGLNSWRTKLFIVIHNLPFYSWYRQAHNEYLQGLHEIGIIGVVLALAFIFSILFKSVLIKDCRIAVCSIVLFLICAFMQFPLHIAPTALIFITMLAIADYQVKSGLIRP